ncbi:MAG: ABC transporter permease subunit, partial [Acidimicrobiia bacterium]|nr:ABC transporter permease subunit [Acidimicrobiia bacterium]
TPKGTRPPFWRNVHFIRGALQILAVVSVVGGILFLGNNLRSELIAKNLPTGFDFLTQPTGVTIADSGFSPASPVWKALLIGIKNTFLLVIVGIPFLTILGTLIGIARLSTNWLVAKIATVYVETIRNIPPLLIILFVFNAVILQLPPPSDPAMPLDWFVISNLKIMVPGFTALSGAGIFAGVVVFGVVAAGIVGIWRTRYSERTGQPDHRALWGLGVFIGIMVLGYFILGRPIRMSLPVLDGRIITGGYGGLGAYFAVLIALVLYTASHVAEIVRGSILAVPKGQTEAANAIALSGFQRLRYVTLPQAFRIALPPIINQFLNFAKNTSLAIAISYAEITLITFQLIGNGYPAPQLILLLMLAYLLFSLTISILVNILNRRLQLVGN